MSYIHTSAIQPFPLRLGTPILDTVKPYIAWIDALTSIMQSLDLMSSWLGLLITLPNTVSPQENTFSSLSLAPEADRR